MIYALNKSDLAKSDEIKQKIEMLNLIENKKWIQVSAKTGRDVNNLKDLIKDIIGNLYGPKINKNYSNGN